MEIKNTAVYPVVYQFTKRDNLAQYALGKNISQNNMAYSYYNKEREISLFLMVRYIEGNRCMCKIKCPISPLPIKGEFEAPSVSAVERFLCRDGWRFNQKLYPRMFIT